MEKSQAARKAIRKKAIAYDIDSLQEGRIVGASNTSDFLRRRDVWKFLDENNFSVRDLHRGIPNKSLKRIRELVDRRASPEEVLPWITRAVLVRTKMIIDYHRSLKNI